MSILINYKNRGLKTNSANLILFVDENFNISGLKNYISKEEFSYISDLLKTGDLKKIYFFLKLIQKNSIFSVY